MRSRIFVSAALPCLGLCLSLSSIAHAADPKAKKKSSTTEISDDKGIGKTLSWEDKVMGEDDKRGELDKILKAQAINKAATEKAEREKAKADAAAAKEAAKEAAAPKPAKKNSEVSIGALPDEGPSKGSSKARSTEISPKLETAAAAAPPPPAKPADDKFIDKLLRDEGGAGKKRKTAADDRALQELIAGDDKAKAPAGKKGKRSEVDNLLENADKEPEVAPVKVRHETPEWAKPEIQATPTPAPVVARPVQRRDDGVIRVVQGAAGSGSARPVAPPPAEPVVTRTPTPPPGRRQASMPAARHASGGGWDDPFATESTAPKKTASRAVRPSDDDFAPAAPAPRKNVAAHAAGWDDPFADSGSRTAGKRSAATATRPAKSGGGNAGWKDPFTDESASSKSARRSEVAPPAKTTARKTVAARDSEDGDSAPAQSHSRWGVLKKR
jgi:hypothetical protein